MKYEVDLSLVRYGVAGEEIGDAIKAAADLAAGSGWHIRSAYMTEIKDEKKPDPTAGDL